MIKIRLGSTFEPRFASLRKALGDGRLDVVNCLLLEDCVSEEVCTIQQLFLDFAREGDSSKLRYFTENFRNEIEQEQEILCAAAENGHSKIVKYLLEEGFGGEDEETNCPHLVSAAANGHIEIVEDLICRSYNLNFMEGKALRLAARNGHLKVVECLVEWNADVHAKGDDALYKAAKYGHVEIVKYLIKHGADIHAKEEKALYGAAGWGHIEIVKLLVEEGAIINDRAVKIAREWDHHEVAKYFIEKEKMIIEEIFRGLGKEKLELVKLLLEQLSLTK